MDYWCRHKNEDYQIHNNNNGQDLICFGFDLLPNELVLKILTKHLDPLWTAVCKSVCHRWNRLLACLVDREECHKNGCKYAHSLALEGHLGVLQWARSQGCPWDADTCANAARGGHLEVLQWARMQGCPWDERTCTHAAEGGHLEMLQWARSHSCPWDLWTCALAAQRGHLEVLQWLRSQGCPWDEDTCALAAEGGHLEVLLWARSQGCPWNEWMNDKGNGSKLLWSIRVNACNFKFLLITEELKT